MTAAQYNEYQRQADVIEEEKKRLAELPKETTMIIPEAISILKIHQQWRLGADIVMIEPKELTKAIDVLINYHIDIMNETLSSQTEISYTDIEFAATNAWVEFNKKDSDDSESFYKGWELAIKWYREQLKQKL